MSTQTFGISVVDSSVSALDDFIARIFPEGSDDAELLDRLQALGHWDVCKRLTEEQAGEAYALIYGWVEEAGKELSNLLAETLHMLASNGCAPSQVRFVTSGQEVGSWESFARMAKTLWYDDESTTPMVNMDLKVVGPNWWLERRSWPRGEAWTFCRLPQRFEDARPLATLWEDEIPSWLEVHEIQAATL